MQPVVIANGLTKHFKSVNALTGLDITIEQGEVVGLLGPNGSGKSTFVRLLLGFLRPTSGAASVLGMDCTSQSVEVHKHVAYLPGDARMFRTMRGFDVLKFFGNIRGEMFIETATQISKQLDLDLSRWVAFMSTGMRQKLAIAVVMAMDTPVAILDEPTANLDPSVRSEVLSLVETSCANGRTIIFSSHVLSEIEQVCSRAVILRSGKLVHDQSLNAMSDQHQVQIGHDGGLPTLPTELSEFVYAESGVASQDNSIQTTTLMVHDNLKGVLSWLASCDLKSLDIRAANLRTIYEQHHKAEF